MASLAMAAVLALFLGWDRPEAATDVFDAGDWPPPVVTDGIDAVA